MWPFGKKKETERTRSPQELQVQEFAKMFLPEEFTLVAVTGPDGMTGDRQEGDTLWTLTMPLTAWMDEADGVVNSRPALMQVLADDRLREYLSQRLPANFIIKARVRPSSDGGRFQLVGMPEPGFDPELKAILSEQLKPITLETEDMGTFTLSRSMNWFERQADWLGRPILLTFDRDEDPHNSLSTARILLDGAADWDSRLRDLAADRLLDRANEQLQDEPVCRGEFLDSLTPESLHVSPNGSFAFWYGSDLLFGQAARITGTVANGPADVRLED